MLQNAYLDAKFRFDTADNEPIEKSDVSWHIGVVKARVMELDHSIQGSLAEIDVHSKSASSREEELQLQLRISPLKSSILFARSSRWFAQLIEDADEE